MESTAVNVEELTSNRLRKVSHWDGLASGLEKREDAGEDMGVKEGSGDKNGNAARRRACWCACRERCKGVGGGGV